MSKKRTAMIGIFSALGLCIVVLDSKTALSGAASGIELCIKTVIPALFPFLFLTSTINNTLTGMLNKIFAPLGKLCKIPEGAELNMVLGLLGGYPVGAQAVYAGYRAGQYPKDTAQRMLSFCNNPGPAFIFGMVGYMFDSVIIPWIIWMIVILCVLITAWIQPPSHIVSCKKVLHNPSGSLESSIKAIAKICGWVILFRTFIAVLQRWILWLLPLQISTLLIGLLELANGCATLLNCQDMVFRFCCVCVMLTFGGLCVTMQTIGIAGPLVSKQYFLAKTFQMLLSVPISIGVASFVFSQPLKPTSIIIAIICFFAAILMAYFLRKNNAGNSKKIII